MTYLFLIYVDPDRHVPGGDIAAARPAFATMACGREPGDSLILAEELHPPHSATTVRIRDGTVLLSDGPCVPAGEQLTALYLVTARDLNQAIRVAACLPTAEFGSVEIRTVREAGAQAPRTAFM